MTFLLVIAGAALGIVLVIFLGNRTDITPPTLAISLVDAPRAKRESHASYFFRTMLHQAATVLMQRLVQRPEPSPHEPTHVADEPPALHPIDARTSPIRFVSPLPTVLRGFFPRRTPEGAFPTREDLDATDIPDIPDIPDRPPSSSTAETVDDANPSPSPTDDAPQHDDGHITADAATTNPEEHNTNDEPSHNDDEHLEENSANEPHDKSSDERSVPHLLDLSDAFDAVEAMPSLAPEPPPASPLAIPAIHDTPSDAPTNGAAHHDATHPYEDAKDEFFGLPLPALSLTISDDVSEPHTAPLEQRIALAVAPDTDDDTDDLVDFSGTAPLDDAERAALLERFAAGEHLDTNEQPQQTLQPKAWLKFAGDAAQLADDDERTTIIDSLCELQEPWCAQTLVNAIAEETTLRPRIITALVERYHTPDLRPAYEWILTLPNLSNDERRITVLALETLPQETLP